MINGKLLNNLRLQKGLSIDDVADALNVSTSTVYRWEREDSLKDRDTIEKYAEVLGVSVSYLLTGQQSEIAVTVEETETTPEIKEPHKNPLSLFKIGLISAGASLLFFIILAALIVVCVYFQQPVGDSDVHFWIITAEEIVVILSIVFLGTALVTTITVLTCFLIRRNRNKTK